MPSGIQLYLVAKTFLRLSFVETECRKFAKIMRSLEKFIRTVKGQDNFSYRILRILFLPALGGFSYLIHYNN